MPNYYGFNCEMDTWYRRTSIAFLPFYSLICLFGMFGNGLVIFITGIQMKKTFTTVFFLNLAIADFIVTFFLLVTNAFIFDRVVYDRPHMQVAKEMCQFVNTIKFLNLYSSVLFLMAISLARYLSVRYPVWARNHQTPLLGSLMALGVWILSLGLSCAYLYTNADQRNGTGAGKLSTLSENSLTCLRGYVFLYREMSHFSSPTFIIHVMLSFILPFIFMVSCYGATIYRLRKSQFVQTGKPFKAITAVMVAFFVCWFPLNLITFMEMKLLPENCIQFKVFLTFYNISAWLAYFNSCLNPILYVFIGRHYRKSLRCSLFSALENAFREEISPGRTRTEDNSPAPAESQNL